MAEEHKRPNLGASAWHRWSKCLGSVGFIMRNADRLPEDKSSQAADEGTLAHKYCEDMLRLGFSDSVITDGMRNLCEVYLQTVEEQCANGAELLIENKLPLPYQPERNTIADSVVWDKEAKTLYINDLKYGSWEVKSKDNFQLLIGAGAVLKSYGYKPKHIVMTIVQPKCGSVPEAWAPTRDEFYGMWDKVSSTANFILKNLDERLPLVPSSSACKFCPARPICPACNDTSLLKRALYPTDSLPPRVVSMIAFGAPRLKASIESCVAYAHDALNNGRGELVPGLTLTDGRKSARKWADEESAKTAVSSVLGEDAYKKTLITPLQAVNKIKKVNPEYDLSSLIIEGEPTKKLAPISQEDIEEFSAEGGELDSPFQAE